MANTRLPVVDRSQRNRLAELLEQLLSGELTVHRFEEKLSCGRFVDSNDRAVVTVCNAFDELGEEGGVGRDHVFSDARYSESTVKNVRRAALFLRTDLEYGWPDVLFQRSADYTIACIFATFMLTLVMIPVYWPLALYVFGFGCSAAVCYKFVHDWLEPRRLDRQILRHRDEGRDFGVWPFLRRSDCPPGLEDLIRLSDDPRAASERVK